MVTLSFQAACINSPGFTLKLGIASINKLKKHGTGDYLHLQIQPEDNLFCTVDSWNAD